MSEFRINHRGLIDSKEIPTQGGVTLAVRHEVHWHPGDEQRKPLNFLSIKGTGQRHGAPLAVNWTLPASAELAEQINAFLNRVDTVQHSRELLHEFNELEIACEPNDWLTLVWVFSDFGATGHATFRKDDTTITANFANSEAIAMIRNALV